MTPRAEMAAALATVAVGALVALVASGQPDGSVGDVAEPATGSTGTPAAAALSLVLLAGVGALLLVRARTRSWLGILMAVAALGVVAVNLAAARSGWSWLGAIGGLVAVGGAALVTARAGRWPQPRRRFDAPRSDQASAGDTWDALDRGEDPTR